MAPLGQARAQRGEQAPEPSWAPTAPRRHVGSVSHSWRTRHTKAHRKHRRRSCYSTRRAMMVWVEGMAPPRQALAQRGEEAPEPSGSPTAPRTHVGSVSHSRHTRHTKAHRKHTRRSRNSTRRAMVGRAARKPSLGQARAQRGEQAPEPSRAPTAPRTRLGSVSHSRRTRHTKTHRKHRRRSCDSTPRAMMVWGAPRPPRDRHAPRGENRRRSLPGLRRRRAHV